MGGASTSFLEINDDIMTSLLLLKIIFVNQLLDFIRDLTCFEGNLDSINYSTICHQIRL